VQANKQTGPLAGLRGMERQGRNEGREGMGMKENWDGMASVSLHSSPISIGWTKGNGKERGEGNERQHERGEGCAASFSSLIRHWLAGRT